MNALAIADVVRQLALLSGLTEDQVGAVLQAQAELAYRLAPQGYPIPGLGVLALLERPNRTIVMKFGPKKGQPIDVPAAKKVSFRVASILNQMVLHCGSPVPDVLTIELSQEEEPLED
jgi:nucleoid DNA-binding protein